MHQLPMPCILLNHAGLGTEGSYDPLPLQMVSIAGLEQKARGRPTREPWTPRGPAVRIDPPQTFQSDAEPQLCPVEDHLLAVRCLVGQRHWQLRLLRPVCAWHAHASCHAASMMSKSMYCCQAALGCSRILSAGAFPEANGQMGDAWGCYS